jgi:hypothetical protein
VVVVIVEIRKDFERQKSREGYSALNKESEGIKLKRITIEPIKESARIPRNATLESSGESRDQIPTDLGKSIPS